MSPVEVVNGIPDGGDPVIGALKWLAIMVVVVLVAAAPLMSYLRKFNSDRAANAKDSAESALYKQLAEQVGGLQTALNDVYEKYRKLQEEHVNAVARLSKVEEYEKSISSMKSRLDEKDARLLAKDQEIMREREYNRQLTLEIISLKDRISELEKRLLKDENDILRIGRNEQVPPGAMAVAS